MAEKRGVTAHQALARQILLAAQTGLKLRIVVEGEGAKFVLNSMLNPSDPNIVVTLGDSKATVVLIGQTEETLAPHFAALSGVRAYEQNTRETGEASIALTAYRLIKDAMEAMSKLSTAPAATVASVAPPASVETAAPELSATAASNGDREKQREAARVKFERQRVRKQKMMMGFFYLVTLGLGWVVVFIGNTLSARGARQREAQREAVRQRVIESHRPKKRAARS